VIEPKELNFEDLEAILERARTAALSADEYQSLKAVIETLARFTQELERKNTSIHRLRQMLFGPSTEKTKQVLAKTKAARKAAREAAKGKTSKEKAKGHGRNGADAFPGAEHIKVPHPTLRRGDCCPECAKGKLYPLRDPSPLVRIKGVPPLSGKVYECDQYRCNLCQEVFTAPAPADAGEEKYDETATAMIGVLKYGTGFPFNRLDNLQAGMGVPVPAATQWDLARQGANDCKPAHDELVRQAAQGDVFHNDDTPNKVMELIAKREQEAAEGTGDERTGAFTSGIVSICGENKIALFVTGAQHAGENLAAVLKQRAAELPVPIQMCDCLSANAPGEFKTILSACISHSRRKYVDVAVSFPGEVRYVLETLAGVYKTDAAARERKLSAEERLALHQAESGPLMRDLETWMQQQFDERKVEPNSTLGEAIEYMQKHWTKLTLFLRVPGAPLDNNICERALKKAILHRKNALFYKTLNGARVGDIFMSLIYTAELNGIAPFDYLVALLQHPADVASRPGDWMPWNYQATLSTKVAAAA
jgi:transposase